MTARCTVFFEPLDVLQFRDHRPFDMGEHAVARTVFPGPSTFRGALRTLLFRAFGARFEMPWTPDEAAYEHFGVEPGWVRSWLGGRKQPGSIAIRGPLLARLTSGVDAPFETFFHAPRDLAAEKKGAAGEPLSDIVYRAAEERAVVGPELPTRFRWSAGVAQRASAALPWSEAEPEKGGGPGYLTLTGARAYFAAGSNALSLSPPSAPALSVREGHLLQHEPRVGIARDGVTLAAEEGMFYITAPYRAGPGVGFAVDVDLPPDSAADASACLVGLQGAVTPLGGKAHRARVHVFDRPLVPDSLAPGAARGPQKVWLQTALPLPVALPGGTLVVADRSVPIGGFDFALRAPKRLRSALPAGTIIHLPEGAHWPPSTLEAGSGYGFALISPDSQPHLTPEGESR